MHVAVGACGATCVAYQAEKAVVEDNLLRRAPPMLTGLEEEKKKRKEASIAAVDATLRHWMPSGCVEPLRAFELMRYPGAFHRALYGDSPARVKRMVAHRKPRVRVVRGRPRVHSPKQNTSLEHSRLLETQE